jgi:hypothetical protein
MLAGLLLPLDAVARGKGKKRKSKGTEKKRATAQAEPCWRAGACIVSKGSNVSQCDLAGYIAPDPLDCTRCNLSRANLRGADLSGVNFTRANLSGACLIDADFTDATFANSTNLANAIFCRTIMPDGSSNNSGCDSATACCPICLDGAQCGNGQFCCNGTCANCPCGQVQLSNGTCATPCTSGNQCCASCEPWIVNPTIMFCSTDILFANCVALGDNGCPTGQFCSQFGFCMSVCQPPG